MGFNSGEIARRVIEMLRDQPFMGLKAIARVLLLDRHTVTNALEKECNKTFTELQLEIVREELDRRQSDSRLKELKDVAAEFHCSPRALGRRLKTLGISWTKKRK